MRELVKEYYETFEIYPGGGKGPGITNATRVDNQVLTQNSTWDQARHHVSVGLNAAGGQSAKPGLPTACSKCKGAGHHPSHCPNIAAAKDPKWVALSEDDKKHACRTCRGVGHKERHHQQFIKQLADTQSHVEQAAKAQVPAAEGVRRDTAC